MKNVDNQLIKTEEKLKESKYKKINLFLFGIGFLCSIITGFFLVQLSEIPFGFLFQFVMYLFVFSLLILFFSAVIFCFRSSRLWLRITGLIPILLSVVIIMLTLIVNTDYRILYFQSLSPKPTKTEWLEDLHFLRDQMKERHCDLDALISKEELDDTLIAIESRLPQLSDSEIVMELFRLTAMPGDAHTFPFIMMPCFDIHTFPIQVYGFEDGWTIVEAGREFKDLIGAKILKIGSIPIEDIYNNYPLFLSTESEYSYKSRFPYMCIMAEWLAYNNIVEDIQSADFTLLEKNGEEMLITIPSMKFYPHFLWSSVFTIDNNEAPVYTNPRNDNFRFELLDESNTLFIQFNQCVNEAGKITMDEFVIELEAFVKNNKFERCVIDIRNNDGGDNVWPNLVSFIRDNRKVNQYGRLFVLIGRRTFSSAVLFANQLQMQTNAIFIGEPTGQGPIFYAGPYLIELPNSRLVFAVSRHLSISGFPFDKRKSIIPDITVKYSSDDFIDGSDPVLDTAQSIIIPAREVKRLPTDVKESYTGRYLLNPVNVMDVSMRDASLHISFTDFIPDGLQRFQSELFPETEESFRTRISGMNILFTRPEISESFKLSLIWQNDTVTFKRAATDYTSAMELISLGEVEAGCNAISKDKNVYLKHIPTLERMLNNMGYDLMRKDELKSALSVFKLNTELYPESYNVYDSYGEALLKAGDKDEAIKNYRQSLIINPDSKSGKKVLKELGVEM